MTEVQTILRRVNSVAKTEDLAVHVEGRHAEIVHVAALGGQVEATTPESRFDSARTGSLFQDGPGTKRFNQRLGQWLHHDAGLDHDGTWHKSVLEVQESAARFGAPLPDASANRTDGISLPERVTHIA